MILLSLLGEQPIPNLLPLWQAGAPYAATQFAATKATLPLAHALAEAIRHDPQLGRLTVLPPITLEAYDIRQARARLAEIIAQHQLNGQAVTVNLTGGTKLMSLAALQAAFGSGVPLLYVSTEENRLIHLNSDGSERLREALTVQISVAQYLIAHGLEVSATPNFGAGPVSPRPTAQGDALEKRVLAAALKSGAFDDARRGVFVRKQTERGPVINELDVVVTRNGRLAVCSCKTTEVASKTGRDAMKDAVYELASLSRREAIGIYCGKILVSNQPELPVALRDRARASGVRLVYGKELSQVAEHLKLATR